MSEAPIRETAAAIEEAAARWAMRLDRLGHDPETLAELEAWLGTDTRRRGALVQAQAALHLATEPEPAPDSVPATPLLRRRAVFLGGAALALAATAAGVLLWLPWRHYSTALGEVRRVPLADGSVAEINTASTLAVRFEPERRTVVLDRGEAWFQVANDKARPFTVEAGRIRVRAVGTAFSVRRRAAASGQPAGAEVLVSEGLVEAWAEGAEGARIRVAAGERAFIADNAAVAKVPPAQAAVDRALAWRGGKIDLAGEPLAAAAAEFNRYNARKIILADPALGGERLYGVFRMDDPEGFANTVRQSLGTEVTVTGDEIRIGG